MWKIRKNMLEDFRLKVFMTVAQERSFTKASLVLDVTQPAVSQNISALEKELDVKLFERMRGEVALTAEGHIFMQYAQKQLKMTRTIENLFASLPSAVVKISSSEELYTYHISPRLSEFAQIHPQIQFERSIFGDADMKFSIRPSGIYPSQPDTDILGNIRISLSAPENEKGDIAVTHEYASCFEIVCQTEASFACTRLCRILKEFLTLNS